MLSDALTCMIGDLYDNCKSNFFYPSLPCRLTAMLDNCRGKDALMMVLTRVYISLHSALAWRMHDDWCDSLPFVARLFKIPPNFAFACIHFVCEENQIVCEENVF